MEETSLSGEEMMRVWQRVTENNAASPDIAQREQEYDDKKEAERMREYILGMRREAETYDYLARGVRGGTAEQIFRRICQEKKKQEKLLQTEYFVLTGDTYAPKTVPRVKGSLVSAVRERYIEEGKNAREFESAAERVRDSQTASVYRELAQMDRRHAVKMRALIERLME